MDIAADNPLQIDNAPTTVAEDVDTPVIPEADKALVKRIIANIRADKKFHEKPFKRMIRDMQVATHGAETSWGDAKYVANITGRHIRQKTAALYAKNPKAVARRRETLDFAVWDENPQSLMIAMQTMQAAQQAIAQAEAAPQPAIDPVTGQPAIDPVTGAPVAAPPQMPPGYEQAQAILEDFTQGMERREKIKKFGRTLEILFALALREQKPLDFKTAMKQLVRRTCTTTVGYIELGFQREMGPRPGMTERLTDDRARLEHLKAMVQNAQKNDDITETSAEIAEIEHSMAALQSEEQIVLREGLVFDFLQSTKVIPDRACTQLIGFVGANHLSIEYLYTKSKVQEVFGVDLGKKFTPYTVTGKRGDGITETDSDGDQGDFFGGETSDKKGKDDYCCVWKYYDKETGLVYYVCDGYDGYLRTPEAPEVAVSDFWPVYALTFNAVENEDELFPPSDVALMLDMQKEYNRSRQGKREHRQAARPRWVTPRGALSDEDKEQLKSSDPFDVVELTMDPATDVKTILQSLPVPGVDPNLYDTGEIWQDTQVVVGTQQAILGGVSRATATESSIAANSTASADGSSIDDLDAFMTMIARASSQIMMANYTTEQVMALVGPGAIWVDQMEGQIFEEMYLDVEAGSTGKPNQAVEMANWEKMLPFLIQMGSIDPTWLARETIRRLDDKMDLTEAVVAGIPSIVAQNAMQQPGTGDPATDPTQQGGAGENNGPQAPGGPSGSSAPMGDNHTTPGVIKYSNQGQRVT